MCRDAQSEATLSPAQNFLEAPVLFFKRQDNMCDCVKGLAISLSRESVLEQRGTLAILRGMAQLGCFPRPATCVLLYSTDVLQAEGANMQGAVTRLSCGLPMPKHAVLTEGRSRVHNGCKNKHSPSGETRKAVACRVKEPAGAKECASCVLTKLHNQMLGSIFVTTQLPYQICPHG